MVVTASGITKRSVRFDLVPRRVTVTAVEPISATYVRVTLQGPALATFQSADPDDHIKVAFPAPGASEPVLPVAGPDGMQWPVDAPRILRDYTPRRFDPAKQELVVDFVVHGHGPASAWASQAAPGQVLGILGPRGSRVVEGSLDWQLLIGDETALPSIARRLEEATAGERFVAFVEVDGPADEQAIETRAEAEIHWVHRNGAVAGATTVLEDALRSATLPSGVFYTRAHGEANTLKSIRRYLVGERGIDPGLAAFSGHWKLGIANHDHHEPIED
jgi:NADPH-dependent ferric siderophore reductase